MAWSVLVVSGVLEAVWAVALGTAYALILLTPFARDFFALAPPGPELAASAVGAVVAAAGLWLVDDRFAPVPPRARR